MLYCKCKKILIISFVALLLIMSVTAIIWVNNGHIKHCHKGKCALCDLVELSIEFIRNLKTVKIQNYVLIPIVYVMQLIYKSIQELRKSTLVELKIIQNK